MVLPTGIFLHQNSACNFRFPVKVQLSLWLSTTEGEGTASTIFKHSTIEHQA
jgi:hypothetical protein